MNVLIWIFTWIVIPGMFIVNLGVFWLTRWRIIALEKIVYPRVNRRDGISAELTVTAEECEMLRNRSSDASMLYSFYSNFTAVFPLLGILGTVMSLMNIGTADLSSSFSSALITTLLGLIAAIIFKGIDAVISSRLERALEEADYLIHQHDIERRDKKCEEKETL